MQDAAFAGCLPLRPCFESLRSPSIRLQTRSALQISLIKTGPAQREKRPDVFRSSSFPPAAASVFHIGAAASEKGRARSACFAPGLLPLLQTVIRPRRDLRAPVLSDKIPASLRITKPPVRKQLPPPSVNDADPNNALNRIQLSFHVLRKLAERFHDRVRVFLFGTVEEVFDIDARLGKRRGDL